MGTVLGKRLAATPLEAVAASSRMERKREDFDPSSGRCLDAFTVVLNQFGDQRRWFSSTMELQLASLSFCVACRAVSTARLVIGGSTPRRLPATSKRVPRLRARAVRWKRSSPATLRKLLYALAGVEVFEFWHLFNTSLEDVVWPRRLRVLTFGASFNQPVSGVVWPPLLRKLSFGASFNQPVAGVVWPPSLLQLAFGTNFNQPVADVVWPPSLLQLAFGTNFDQPASHVIWPSSLAGHSLRKLDKDAPNDMCMFFSDFDQPIDEAMWPASLRRLALGGDFSQSLRKLGTCMPHLEELTLLKESYNLLADIEWPKCLKKLTVFAESRKEVERIATPSAVEIIYSPDAAKSLSEIELVNLYGETTFSEGWC